MALVQVGGAAEGLALEAAGFAAEGPTVGLWMARRRAIVCPESLRRKPGFDAAVRDAAARGWPVSLRPTGGGAVPQGPGVLNLALAFTAGGSFGIEDGYRLLTGIIRAAVPAELSPGATPGSFCDGTWNLSIGAQKVVGTAQRLRPVGGGRRRILAHALILVEGDVAAGAGAIDAFHGELGLPPIRAEAHTTLAAALGPGAPGAERLAEDLGRVAAGELENAASRDWI